MLAHIKAVCQSIPANPRVHCNAHNTPGSVRDYPWILIAFPIDPLRTLGFGGSIVFSGTLRTMGIWECFSRNEISQHSSVKYRQLKQAACKHAQPQSRISVLASSRPTIGTPTSALARMFRAALRSAFAE